jgi:hypothetical protein
MNERDRLAGFKALLKSLKKHFSHLEEPDGSFHLRDLSTEGRLEIIASHSWYYDVTFEQFAEAVRESVDTADIEAGALRMATRNSKELHEGRTEPPPSLLERVSELLNADPEHVNATGLTAAEQFELMKEFWADEAAAKREDAHYYGKVTLQEMRDEQTTSPVAEKGKARGIER